MRTSRGVRFREALERVAFKVTQGHWCWCHSIGHVRFLISFLCSYFSILYRFRDIISYLPKRKEVTRPWRRPFGGNLSHNLSTITRQYQSAFEIWSAWFHSFQRYDRDPGHTHFSGL